ncbi:unnamed protein product, partial [Prorocentrum cordatum]
SPAERLRPARSQRLCRGAGPAPVMASATGRPPTARCSLCEVGNDRRRSVAAACSTQLCCAGGTHCAARTAAGTTGGHTRAIGFQISHHVQTECTPLWSLQHRSVAQRAHSVGRGEEEE